MAIPDTMRAVVVRAHGGLEQLEYVEVPVPRPKPTEALIRIRAIGINQLDLWVRRGVATHKYPLPMIPGSDLAGEVVALGDLVTGWSLGDRVSICPTLGCMVCDQCLSGDHNLCRWFGVVGETRDGTYAEYIALPAANLLRIPDSLGDIEAAALPLVMLTAHHMLFRRAALLPGETVLVHAAGSGVGTSAIQLAKMIGARVIATASTEAKLTKARDLGADHTINYVEQDWISEVRTLTGKGGVEVVFENVGATTWEGSLKSLKKGGRLVTCGATSGAIVESDLRLIFFKSLSILGSTMGGLGEMRHIWRLIEQGQLHAVVDRTFPLSEVRAAHAYIENRQQFGKVILLP